MAATIYGLFDPRTDQCRYVGKTKHALAARLTGHINDARRRKHSVRRFSWVLSLLNADVLPVIKELEVVAGSWQEAERRWIAKFRADGVDLVNTTDGGDGCDGMRHSEETKARMSSRAAALMANPDERKRRGDAVRNAYKNPAVRARLSASIRRSRLRPEVRERLSAGLKAYCSDPLVRAKRSAMLKGRVISKEWREKISRTKTGMRRSAESVAKSAAGHRGRKNTQETRLKMSIAAKAREARKREAA